MRIYGEDVEESQDCSCLKKIREKVAKQGLVASFIGVLLDCSGSYLKNFSNDYIAIYKITDPSIFPDFATINIFHKHSDDLPKLKSLGDVVFFQNVSFHNFQGKLCGTLSKFSKSSSFSAHDYQDAKRSPYACFIKTVFMNEDLTIKIEQMKSWVRDSLSGSIFEYLNLKALTELQINSGEVDLIGRVLSVGSLGKSLSDPLVVHLQHDQKLSQVVIPKERKKLLANVGPGDTVRIRSVFKSFGVFVISDFSEVLRIQFEAVKIRQNFALNDLLQKFESATGKKRSRAGVSVIPKNSLRYQKVQVADLEKYPDSSVFRLRVYLVWIRAKAQELEVGLWDGEGEEVVKAFVDKKDGSEFLNGFELGLVNRSERLPVEAFRCLVKIVAGRYQIVETRLAGF